jgi:hypothetical protein
MRTRFLKKTAAKTKSVGTTRVHLALAKLYGLATNALDQAVKRNRTRFPSDFMLRLTAKETGQLNRSQNVTGSQKHGDSIRKRA